MSKEVSRAPEDTYLPTLPHPQHHHQLSCLQHPGGQYHPLHHLQRLTIDINSGTTNPYITCSTVTIFITNFTTARYITCSTLTINITNGTITRCVTCGTITIGSTSNTAAHYITCNDHTVGIIGTPGTDGPHRKSPRKTSPGHGTPHTWAGPTEEEGHTGPQHATRFSPCPSPPNHEAPPTTRGTAALRHTRHTCHLTHQKQHKPPGATWHY